MQQESRFDSIGRQDCDNSSGPTRLNENGHFAVRTGIYGSANEWTEGDTDVD